jgi:hypothetical protein
MGLSFTIAAGPRQSIHYWVRVPWDSRPYFTVSDSRLPSLSPPTTGMATVEVFDPASTWNSDQTVCSKVKVKVMLRPTVSRPVCLGVEPHLGLMTSYLLLFDSYGLVFWGALSDERTGLSFVYAGGPSQRSHSWVRAPWDS